MFRFLNRKKSLSLEEFVRAMRKRGFEVTTFTDNGDIAHWVFSSVDKICKSVASKEWWLLDEKEEEITEGLFFDLVSKPSLAYWDFAYITIFQTIWEGDCYWVVSKIADKPAFVYITKLGQMKIMKDKETGQILGYKLGEVVFKPEDVIHIKLPDPEDPYGYGKGLIDYVRPARKRYDYINQYEFNLLEKGTPSLAITGFKNLAEMEKVLKDMRAELKGLENAGKLIGILKGQGIEKVNLTPAELDFSNSRRATREEITGVMGVPLAMLGITEKVNRANMETSIYMFERFTVNPLAKRFAEAWQSILKPYKIQFKIDLELPRDNLVLDKRIAEAVKTGIITRNEAREMWGFDKTPDGDVYLVPPTLMELPQQRSEKEYGAIQVKKDVSEVKAKRDMTYWANWIRLLNKHTNKAGEKVEQVYKWAMKKIVKALNSFQKSDAVIEGILIDADVLTEKFFENITQAMQEAGQDEIDFLNVSLGLGIEFSKVNPALQQEFSNLYDFYKNTCVDTVLNAWRGIIKQGIDEGLTMREIARKIQDEFPSIQRHAYTVARTEVGKATGLVDWRAFIEANIPHKVWFTALDERVRTWHIDAHEQKVLVSEPFIVNGEELMYPRDFSGSAENVINCRCVMVTPE